MSSVSNSINRLEVMDDPCVRVVEFSTIHGTELFTDKHLNCTVMAHNFEGYDSYFILQYLREHMSSTMSSCPGQKSGV